KDRNMYHIIDEVYAKCKTQEHLPDAEVTNFVKEIYNPFTDVEISDKISEMLHPETVKADLKVMFQTVENLHISCPDNLGDWYFTGNYPTAGGNRVVNRAFMNFVEGNDERAY
ncbi:MAG: amidophosphoribosyltransferase, partial [Myroides sp.]